MARVMPVWLERDLAAVHCRVAMLRGEFRTIVPRAIGDHISGCSNAMRR